MALGLILNKLIGVVITFFVVFFNMLIFMRTKGASKAYYFFAMGALFIFIGHFIALVGSMIGNPNEIDLGGSEAVISIIHLSVALLGYSYIALGAIYLPADLDITKFDLKKILNFRKLLIVGATIWSCFIILLLALLDEIAVRMFYIPFFAVAWFVAFYAILPMYNTVKEYAKYWIYLLVGCLFGFLANIIAIVSYIVLGEIIILETIIYALMGLSVFVGFYKLGKDVEAF